MKLPEDVYTSDVFNVKHIVPYYGDEQADGVELTNSRANFSQPREDDAAQTKVEQLQAISMSRSRLKMEPISHFRPKESRGKGVRVNEEVLSHFRPSMGLSRLGLLSRVRSNATGGASRVNNTLSRVEEASDLSRPRVNNELNNPEHVLGRPRPKEPRKMRHDLMKPQVTRRS